MPPRYAYWTILIDNAPTAFRAKEQADLLPTVAQLRRTNKDVALKWFAQGRVWNSPEDALRAKQPPARTESRGRDWRPGGEHKDPRARFDKPKDKKPKSDRGTRPGPAWESRGERGQPRQHSDAPPFRPAQRPASGGRPRDDRPRHDPGHRDNRDSHRNGRVRDNQRWTDAPRGDQHSRDRDRHDRRRPDQRGGDWRGEDQRGRDQRGTDRRGFDKRSQDRRFSDQSDERRPHGDRPPGDRPGRRDQMPHKPWSRPESGHKPAPRGGAKAKGDRPPRDTHARHGDDRPFRPPNRRAYPSSGVRGDRDFPPSAPRTGQAGWRPKPKAAAGGSSEAGGGKRRWQDRPKPPYRPPAGQDDDNPGRRKRGGHKPPDGSGHD